MSDFAVRLDNGFKALRSAGYFARKNFTCCSSCGWAEVPEKKSEKAVFFHRQDSQDLDRHGFLYLAWSGNGAEIVRLLAKEGLTVFWNGSKKTRILVVDETTLDDPRVKATVEGMFR